MEMAHLGGVAVRFSRSVLCVRHALRLLGWCQRMDKLESEGDYPDGPKHSHGDSGAGCRTDDRGNGDSENRPKRIPVSFEPPEILGGIALIGLLAYALIRGMDATVAGMLTGLFGVLLGRSTRKNGKHGQ